MEILRVNWRSDYKELPYTNLEFSFAIFENLIGKFEFLILRIAFYDYK